LNQSDRRAEQCPSRRRVAHSGDLRLVRHESDQPEPGAGGDGGGEGAGRPWIMHWRAAYPEVQPPAQRSPGGVQVKADPQLGPVAWGADGVHQIKLSGIIDHQGHRGGERRITG